MGHRLIGASRSSEIKGWVNSRSAVLAPATVEVIYRYAASVFRAAVDDEDRIIYNSATGALLFDADGAQAVSSQIQFAQLNKGLAMTESEFVII